MTTFFLRLFAVSAAGILAETLTEAFGNSKTVKIVASLCLLLTLGSLFASLPDAVETAKYGSSVFFETPHHEPPTDTLAKKTAEALQKRIMRDIFEETGISPLDVRIDYTTGDSDPLPHITRVTVVMPHGSRLTDDYVASLSKYLASDVRVTYEK